MRVLTKTQNNEAWECARKGRVTASAINKCLAGKHTKGRFEYMMNLILDLEGIGDFRDSAPWFEKGRKFERYALGWYQFEQNVTVEAIGFVLHDDFNWLGASPDGLVGDESPLIIDNDTGQIISATGNGLVEIKYRDNLRTFEKACTQNISAAYDNQMQTQMAVCNRQWCDYMNYWRSVDGKKEQGHVRRVERDDGKIRELEEAALHFWREVVDTYRHRTKRDFIRFPFSNYKGKID